MKGDTMEKRNADGLTEKEFLEQYNPGNYEKPSVTVDMMLLRMTKDLKNLQILLIKRKNHPYIDCWALPGGFVDMKESAYEAACRELKEETSLENVYMEQLYTMSRPDRDPRMRVIDIAYLALLPYDYDEEAQAGDDAKEAVWFDISFTNDWMIFSNDKSGIKISYKLDKRIFINGKVELTNYIPSKCSDDSLAFDHADIVLEGLSRIRSKVMYTDIVFNLVPDEFTLPDLQCVYEQLVGRDVYKANFRDKIKGKIIETNNLIKPMTSRRTSKAYKYNSEV